MKCKMWGQRWALSKAMVPDVGGVGEEIGVAWIVDKESWGKNIESDKTGMYQWFIEEKVDEK